MEFEREVIVLFSRVQIRYYGIILVLAMLVAAWVAARLARRDGRDPDHVWGALTWAIIPAILGARLWFILFPPASLTAGCFDEVEATICQNTMWFLQTENITNLQNGPFAIWNGGLGIFGAVIGGFLGAYIYFRRNNLPLGPWADIAGVTIPLGQAIGRWANFVNQELYGTVTNLPWGISIDAAHRVEPYDNLVEYPASGPEAVVFHPLFLYESLWSILAFVVLLQVFQRYRKYLVPGDLFLLYVMQYGVIRFLLEFLRAEPAFLPGTTTNSSQTTTIIMFVVALAFFLYRHRPGAPQPVQDTPKPKAKPPQPKPEPSQPDAEPAQPDTDGEPQSAGA